METVLGEGGGKWERNEIVLYVVATKINQTRLTIINLVFPSRAALVFIFLSPFSEKSCKEKTNEISLFSPVHNEWKETWKLFAFAIFQTYTCTG